MIGSVECPHCGKSVPLLAHVCDHCGALNRARLPTIGLAALGVTLFTAAAIAIYIAPAAAPPGAPDNAASVGNAASAPEASRTAAEAPAARAAAPEVDLAPLQSAMKTCDAQAARTPGTLFFLLIPLVADPKDLPDWRLLAKGAIGNAFTIRSDDALGGLRHGTLRISPDQYVLGVQDVATGVVNEWEPSSGVKSFSTNKLEKVRSYRLRLQPRQKAYSGDWGESYNVQAGNCDWVAAIVPG